MTVAGAARTQLTVPDGSRLFLAPCVGGDVPFGYVILPKTNALWSTTGLFPTSSTGESLTSISAPLTASHATNAYAFAGAASLYAAEVGTKEKGLGSWSVADPKGYALGTQDAALSTDQTISAKMTLAHLELDSTVSTTYAGKTAVYAASTDSAGLPPSTMKLTAAGDQDANTYFRVRRLPGDSATQTLDGLRQITARWVAGTANRSFHQTGRLCYPTFWNSAQTSTTNSASWSEAEVSNGMAPNANPFFGAAVTGVYLIVEASGAPAEVSIALNALYAYEHIHRADTDAAGSAMRAEMLRTKVHVTSPSPEVRQAAMAQVDHTTEGHSIEAARAIAEVKVAAATLTAPVAPSKRTEPLMTPAVMDPPDDPDTTSVITDIHNSDMPDVVKEILETGAGAGEVIGSFAADARQFGQAAQDTVAGISSGIRSLFGGIKNKWRGAAKPKVTKRLKAK